MTTLTPETEARLLALMRPEDDVAQLAVNGGLQQVIADQSDGAQRIAALAFILRETLFARLSGPLTSRGAYPTPPVLTQQDRAVVRDHFERYHALSVSLSASPAPEHARARAAWQFLEGLPTPTVRVIFLGRMREDPTFTRPQLPQPEVPAALTGCSWETIHAVYWKHRDIIRRIECTIHAAKAELTVVAIGWMVSTELSAIADPIERGLMQAYVLQHITDLARDHDAQQRAIATLNRAAHGSCAGL